MSERIQEIERIVGSDAYTREELHRELDRAMDRREQQKAQQREERDRSRLVTITVDVEIWQKADGGWLVKWPWDEWPTTFPKKHILEIFGFDPEEASK